jgi:hypothetical protein
MYTMKRADPRPRLLSRVISTLGGLARRLRVLSRAGRRRMRALLRRSARQPGHLLRVLGRLRTRARVRRQDKTQTELP